MTRKKDFLRMKCTTDHRVMDIGRLWLLGFKICLIVGTAAFRRMSRVHALIHSHLRRVGSGCGSGGRRHQTRKATRTQDDRNEEDGRGLGDKGVHIILCVGRRYTRAEFPL